MKQKYSTETVELRSNVPPDSVYANEEPIEALAGRMPPSRLREAATPSLGVQQRFTPHFFVHIKFLRAIPRTFRAVV